MREEYNIMNLKPRKNPYVKTCKKQDTINPDENVTSHLKISLKQLVFHTRVPAICSKRNRFMIFLLAEILNFEVSGYIIAVESFCDLKVP